MRSSLLGKRSKQRGAALTTFPARAAPLCFPHQLSLSHFSTQLVFLPLPFLTFWDVPCMSLPQKNY